MFEKFMENCREHHAPGQFVTVDETLLEFRGRCSFRMYIPSKSAKYGIKLWTCVDAKSKYLYNARIYLGKGDLGSGEEMVDTLTTGLLHAGRVVVCDNYFTSPHLGSSLLARNTYLLGTLRKNRSARLCQQKNRDAKTKTKCVLVYSTYHHDTSFNDQSKKPTIIADYNKGKCGVDQFDEMIKDLSYSPATRRWPMKILFWLVNVAAFNAWVLYQKQKKKTNLNAGNRRDFLRRLGEQLRKEQVENRAPN